MDYKCLQLNRVLLYVVVFITISVRPSCLCCAIILHVYLCRYFMINIVFHVFVQAWWYPWRFPRENVVLSSYARWEPCLEKDVLTPLKQLFTITFFVRVCDVQSFKILLFFLFIKEREGKRHGLNKLGWKFKWQ